MRHWLDVALVTTLLVAAGFLVRGTIPGGPYPYDEADYMYAASLGVTANATDTPSLWLGDFIRIGLNRGRDSSQRTSLSEMVRSSGDVNLYRHWHGPLQVYWLMMTSAAKGDEATMRSLTLVFHGVTFLVIYFGCLWIVPETWGRTAGVLASSLYLFSYTHLRTAVEIAPHAIFALFAVATLFLVAKMIATGNLRYWYLAVATSALGFVTMEVTLVLLITMAACCWRERVCRGPGVRIVSRSVALFLGIVLLLWPAALLRLSFVKAYLFMAYLAIARSGPWGQVSLFETWRLRVANAPLEWALLGLGVAAYFARSRRDEQLRQLGVPFLIYGVLMVLALLRVTTDSPRYSSPFLPAFHCLAGISLAAVMERWPSKVRTIAVAVVVLGLSVSVWSKLPHALSGDDNVDRSMLALLRTQDIEGKQIWVPQSKLPTVHYYFPQARLRGYLNETDIAGNLDGVLRIAPLRWESGAIR